jgi:hypothetical protein
MKIAAPRRTFKISLLIASALSLATAARAQLTTLQFDADTGTHIDPGNPGHVGEWDDQSGNHLNVFAGNGTSLPANEPQLVANVLNGHSVLRFDGNLNELTRGDATDGLSPVSASLLANSTESTMFFVITPQTPPVGVNGQAPVTWLGTGGNDLIGYTDNGNNLTYVQGSLGTDQISASQPAGWYGNTHVVTLVRNNTVGSIRVDGVTLADNVSFSGSLNTSDTGALYIGTANQHNFIGDIAEIDVYSTGLTSGQIATQEGNLATKYGLTIVPEPSQYASIFAGACLLGALLIRGRRAVRA